MGSIWSITATLGQGFLVFLIFNMLRSLEDIYGSQTFSTLGGIYIYHLSGGSIKYGGGRADISLGYRAHWEECPAGKRLSIGKVP